MLLKASNCHFPGHVDLIIHSCYDVSTRIVHLSRLLRIFSGGGSPSSRPPISISSIPNSIQKKCLLYIIWISVILCNHNPLPPRIHASGGIPGIYQVLKWIVSDLRSMKFQFELSWTGFTGSKVQQYDHEPQKAKNFSVLNPKNPPNAGTRRLGLL